MAAEGVSTIEVLCSWFGSRRLGVDVKLLGGGVSDPQTDKKCLSSAPSFKAIKGSEELVVPFREFATIHTNKLILYSEESKP